jgi:hypothetical protein
MGEADGICEEVITGNRCKIELKNSMPFAA